MFWPIIISFIAIVSLISTPIKWLIHQEKSEKNNQNSYIKSLMNQTPDSYKKILGVFLASLIIGGLTAVASYLGIQYSGGGE